MNIIVLGSGIIGVATAHYLTERGHKVTVVDRQKTCANECSYANGGQLSYSHVEPWASPHMLGRIPGWLTQKHSPLTFGKPFDPGMWKWLGHFLSCCTDRKVRKSSIQMWKLAYYSQKCFHELAEQVNIDYHQSQKGTLHIFSSQKYLQSNIKQAEFQKTLGCDYTLLRDKGGCVAQEPALAHIQSPLAGGLYFPIDGAGDVHTFAQKLAAFTKENGALFRYNTCIEKIVTNGDAIDHIQTDKGNLKADAYVMALGAYSPLLLKPIGINIPIYPLKGYSLSINITAPEKAPHINICDQGNKIVFSRLGNSLRVAGLAEFSGYDSTIDERCIATLKRMTKALFPLCGDIDNATTWSCLRPATPDCSPVLGPSAYRNLFLNTGHGTLGWTLSLGSAKLVADIIDGKTTGIEFGDLTAKRFT